MDSYVKLQDLTAQRESAIDETFDQMARLLQGSDEKGSVQFRIIEGDQRLFWGLTIKDASAKISKKKITKPDLEIVTKAQNWMQIASGALSPLEAFLQGKMRIRGDFELGKRLLTRLAATRGKIDIC